MYNSLDEMDKDERSLLLFLETQATDYGGLVDARHMNDEDMRIVEQWVEDGFVEFGRVCFEDVERLSGRRNVTNWVYLSAEAWGLAHSERHARAKRMWDKRTWSKTEEL